MPSHPIEVSAVESIMKINQWIQKNELFSRIFLFVVVGVISVCLLTVVVIYGRSKDAYVASYQSSNQLLLEKSRRLWASEREYPSIFDIVDESKAVETYLEGDMNQGRTILELNEQLKTLALCFKTSPLVLIGVNGGTFFQNDAVRNQSDDFSPVPLSSRSMTMTPSVSIISWQLEHLHQRLPWLDVRAQINERRNDFRLWWFS